MFMLEVRCRQCESLPLFGSFNLLQHLLMILLFLLGVLLEVHETREAYRLELDNELLHLVVQVEARAQKHQRHRGSRGDCRLVQIDLGE